MGLLGTILQKLGFGDAEPPTSSLAARKELAAELGCPADQMGDSAPMNMWLHKTVLQRLADSGGNIPKDLP